MLAVSTLDSGAAVAIAGVIVAVSATLGMGAFGIRRAQTTSDFFVASRSVPPRVNAAAICGEYLSAASFLGIAGLILRYGADMLWYPLSYTAGYLFLLFFVASPLRRFGAYTIADFAEGRLQSPTARRLASGLVVVLSMAYMVPQLRGAGLTLRVLTGASYWVGPVVIALVVTVNVAMGGMRGVTFVQAFQYWLKWVAIAVPTVFIGGHFLLHRTAWPKAAGSVGTWATSLGSSRFVSGNTGYALPSLVLAQVVGVFGLPHILVRFHTNPDGRAARRTTTVVLGLLGLFYVFPPILGALGKLYTPELVSKNASDTVVLVLAERVFGSFLGNALTFLVCCGAFAAFLSTASGLMISAAGAISQDLLRGEKRDFQLGAVGVGVVIALLGIQARTTDINLLVSWVFAIAASSFSPLIVLGIWWRGLSRIGAIAGLLVGSLSATSAALVSLLGPPLTGWPHALLSQPALWTVPLGFLTMIVVSLLTSRTRPRGVSQMMLTMHAPESLGLTKAFRA